MKQDMIVILDLGSTENTVLARQIRDLGVYSEIHPHDITVEELNALDNVKCIILNGGEKSVEFKGKINVADMINGIKALKNMGEYLGKENLIYRNAIKGINENMNTDIESAFVDDYAFEAFVAEAIIQNLISGAYVDVTDIKNNFKHENFKNVVLKYCEKCGIK